MLFMSDGSKHTLHLVTLPMTKACFMYLPEYVMEQISLFLSKKYCL